MSMPKVLTVLLLSQLAGACATPVETRLSSSGSGVAVASSSMTIVTPDSDGPALHEETRRLFEQALKTRGGTLSPTGDYLVEFAPGQRAADVALAAGPTQSQTSPIQHRSLLQTCKAQLHRVTLVVLRRDSGALAYRGDVEERHCKATLSQTLPVLVEALVADLEKPVGTRVTTRKGQY
jgi:hypothetical protein